jgi:hypothetical protein
MRKRGDSNRDHEIEQNTFLIGFRVTQFMGFVGQLDESVQETREQFSSHLSREITFGGKEAP